MQQCHVLSDNSSTIPLQEKKCWKKRKKNYMQQAMCHQITVVLYHCKKKKCWRKKKKKRSTCNNAMCHQITVILYHTSTVKKNEEKKKYAFLYAQYYHNAVCAQTIWSQERVPGPPFLRSNSTTAPYHRWNRKKKKKKKHAITQQYYYTITPLQKRNSITHC